RVGELARGFRVARGAFEIVRTEILQADIRRVDPLDEAPPAADAPGDDDGERGDGEGEQGPNKPPRSGDEAGDLRDGSPDRVPDRPQDATEAPEATGERARQRRLAVALPGQDRPGRLT